MGFIRLLIILLLVFAAMMFVFYNMASFFFGTKSNRRQIKKDLAYLKKLAEGLTDGLIPFEFDEFKILSQAPVIKTSKKLGSLYSYGVLSTIYQEPLLAFSMKENPRDKSFILLASTDKKEFKLISNGTLTIAYIDDVQIGEINENVQFVGQDKKIIGQIEKNSSTKYQKILLHDKEVAHINAISSNRKIESERVFSLFHDFDHRESDELILLSLYYLFIDPQLN
jgi:hypothetical protein